MLVIVAAEVFLGVLVFVRLPGVPGLFVLVVVPALGGVAVGVAVLVQMLMRMGMGVGVGMGHVAVGMGVGMDVAVLVGVVMPVLVPAGFVVLVAAVHSLLPIRCDADILRRPAKNRNGGERNRRINNKIR